MTADHPLEPQAGWQHPAQAQAVETIVRALEKVGALAGYRPEQIFSDWLRLVESALAALPAHLDHLRQTGQAVETEAIIDAAIFGQASDQEDRAAYFQHFASATRTLLQSVQYGYYDVVGSSYQLYATLNKYTAQFFTPWPVALLMARMTIIDGETYVLHRLQDAAERGARADPDLETLLLSHGLMAALMADDERQHDVFFNQLLPALWPYYDPITIADPCLGSGVLLLAAAAMFPRWAIVTGCVQFYGMDIDPTCVQMARINFNLYGLSAGQVTVQNALTAPDAYMARYPEPYQSVYRALRDAQGRGDQATLRAITADIEAARSGPGPAQLSLFGGER